MRTRLVIPALVLVLAGCPDGGGDERSDGTTETESSSSSTGADTGTGETETGETETTGTEDPPRPQRLVMTSDWRAKRLSLLDYAALRDGARTREDALWKTIELDAWEPGPLEAELSPDGSTAVVAVGPGFFATAIGGVAGAGEGTVPEGGVLLVVDVDEGTVIAELDTAQYPMGVAITEDGSAAWTANYGGNGQSGATVSHIDLQSLTIVEDIDVGPGPEQIDVRDGLAIVNTAGTGSIRLFDVADPAATLSPGVITSNDPSWVLHVGPGARAVAINSVGPPSYSLIDTADPLMPALVETVDVATGIPYAATHGHDDGEILMSILVGLDTSLQLWDTETATLVDQIDVPVMGFVLGLVFDPTDELAIVPVPGANELVLADFGTGEWRSIDWQNVPGPTYVSME